MGTGIPRALEIGLSLVALLLLLPVFAIVALLVAIGSRGPIIYRQERIGRHGRPFTLLKFRTMRTGGAGLNVTARDDPRISQVGKVLRKLKLDELPELWNILTGAMSFVGPRPEVPAYVDLEDPLWQTALAARPGLTDPVTIKLRNEEALLESVAKDRETFYRTKLQPYKLRGYVDYLSCRSWKSDVWVLWETFLSILFPWRQPPPTPWEIAAAPNEREEPIRDPHYTSDRAER